MITGGKSYVTSPPAFSNDAKRLLVCSGNSVSIFSTATGLQVASLEGHTALVTRVIVVPATSKILCYCWTASLDGTIRYWDFSVPELIKTVDIKFPIFSMVIPSLLSQQAETNEKRSKLFAYVSIENTKETEDQSKSLRGLIKKCNLTDSRLLGGVTLTETKQPQFITISPSGKYFGIWTKRKLHIWIVPSTDSERAIVKKITLHHTRNMTVVAFHPTQKIVAAGDVTGRILIWRGFGNRSFGVNDILMSGISMNNDEERPGVRGDDDAESCTTWHWHPSEVNVLSFSSDGAYLYSGGKEGVLVVWQLDTGKKKFLPRIGSPLLYYTDSTDPSLSSISCADNQIHILKMPSMGILKSISGIKLPCSFPKMSKVSFSGVAFDRTSGLVAVRTENYCIQLYSLFDDRGISEVQVCERNYQPSDEITLVVALVALSLDGSMMSTAEVKLAEEGLGGLVCLKFWALGSDNKNFSLSTIVYDPHRDAEISSLTFHPTRCMAVSTSYGADFKVWVCNYGILRKDQVLTNSRWTCHAVASYKKKPMTAAAFSNDGSVLAVAAETVITLWDPDKNILVAVLGETDTPIRTLSFVGKSEYLASASLGSKPQLSVWSMSKLSMSWSYRLHVEAVASTAAASCFAALILLPESSASSETFGSRDGVILFFNAANPIPMATWLVNKAKGGVLAFLQLSQSSSVEGTFDAIPPRELLAYMNGDHEYVLFDPHGKEAHELGTSRRDGVLDLEEAGKFGYASIYGELPEFDFTKTQASSVPSVPSERPWDTIFSGSSHNLPPLTKLCSAFLESLLEKRTSVVE
ncbi:wd40 protein, putative [Ricinus communis]|uniref:Wd40 protein, putative n=1 Tax=Ricinus communis TaxID=3988 RepID=B9T4Q5_RICCO|nr:wd40 protein, putative [Ricinus communis]|eukprot:XP_002533224.1 WD repeat-containing protein 75 [Ricinus communis]